MQYTSLSAMQHVLHSDLDRCEFAQTSLFKRKVHDIDMTWLKADPDQQVG